MSTIEQGLQLLLVATLLAYLSIGAVVFFAARILIKAFRDRDKQQEGQARQIAAIHQSITYLEAATRASRGELDK